MEGMLVTITVLALVTTTVMSVVAWTLMREERRRSEARVASLAAELDAFEPVGPAPAPTPDTVWVARDAGGPVAAPDLFASAAQPSQDATERLFPALVTGAVLMTSCLAVALLLSSIPAAGAPGTATALSEGSVTQPLELLTVESKAVGGRIELSGVVRNPDGTGMVPSVTAVASYFGRDGGFLGSSQSKAVGPLRPGEQASFAVASEIAGEVARYRVSFRGAGDRPLSHRDRREGR